ncbi:MAG: peptide-methionine (S)-S-oxide reductase MsrA [Verrucomicrobia bacterium]|nr:peptide-methionine (S)-S-oxide reductase MsrA [Verrucomicrobiota bacterium]
MLPFKPILLLSLSVVLNSACAGEPPTVKEPAMPELEPSHLETATFGAGCFWCVEAVFELLEGVHAVESGYMGGSVENPTYSAVCEGTTGHAEVTQIHYDPAIISFETLLDWLWRSHDPTTLNRQGYDVGTQYRSAIFYHTEAQKPAAVESKAAAQAQFEDPIVTEITAASTYYPAEDYHQDYYRQHGNQPYCARVIRPKLEKLGLE